jgi:hypothetical protein
MTESTAADRQKRNEPPLLRSMRQERGVTDELRTIVGGSAEGEAWIHRVLMRGEADRARKMEQLRTIVPEILRPHAEAAREQLLQLSNRHMKLEAPSE